MRNCCLLISQDRKLGFNYLIMLIIKIKCKLYIVNPEMFDQHLLLLPSTQGLEQINPDLNKY